MEYYLGVDLGSISLNLVILDENLNIQTKKYIRLLGNPFEIAEKEIFKLLQEYPPNKISGLSCTGIGGKILAENMGGNFISELVSQFNFACYYTPEALTLIEIGGQDAKFVTLEKKEEFLRIKDVQFNSACAAGTGSFLDQQANRFNLDIEEFANIALQSEKPPRIAGRCSVFAKSDMIHLQQIATPKHDIIAGLHWALARNFKATMISSLPYKTPIAFQGGLASNPAMIKAFRDVLDLDEQELIIHKYHNISGAIGAILEDHKKRAHRFERKNIRKAFVNVYESQKEKQASLYKSLSQKTTKKKKQQGPFLASQKHFLGVDIGSVSTNLVLINEETEIVFSIYLPTKGAPIEAVQTGLMEIDKKFGKKIRISGLGTTGSGRYLIANLFGGDYVRNEITAQATAAIFIDPEVDTIFEIGGQDSKYISIKKKAIVDFEMNKACAAGTGSFLEEQAERMGIRIKEEFSQKAFAGDKPASLGDKCTVFIESDLVHHLKLGTLKEDICAGLSYAIVHNYLNRVVAKKKIGNRIFFQGGTANNEAVVEAFRQVMGKNIEVPPYNDVTGAWGIALLVKQEFENNHFSTKFKGIERAYSKFEPKNFICKDCDNYCEIKSIEEKTEKESKTHYYGGRCGKFDISRTKKSEKLPDAFGIRNQLLHELEKNQEGDFIGVIGLPMMLHNYELLPFWTAFFNKIGYRVKTSKRSPKIVQQGINNTLVDICFPLKVSYGHIEALEKEEINYLFLPQINSLPYHFSKINNKICPWSQTVNATFPQNKKNGKTPWLTPCIEMGSTEKIQRRGFLELAKSLKISRKKCFQALAYASKIQKVFKQKLVEEGNRLRQEFEKETFFVLLGRSYNICDKTLNLDIPKKLRDLGIIPLPMDMIPYDQVESERSKSQYWRSTKLILNAQKYINSEKNMFCVYISNFMCGPDSFNQHYFAEETDEKPGLMLEIDEHSADAGIITRLEAYIDSISSRKESTFKHSNRIRAKKAIQMEGKTILMPYMADHSRVAASILKSQGYDAVMMEGGSNESLAYGRKACNGKECFPCHITTGDFIHTLKTGKYDPKNTILFMPGSTGPCRFGEYNHLQKRLVEASGYPEIEFMAPNQDEGNLTETLFKSTKAGIKFWEGAVCVDYLQKALHQTRPYEIEKGKTDKIYEESLKSLLKACEEKKDLLASVQKSVEDFQNIKINLPQKRIVIGMVGEIFLRFNRFGNEEVIRQVEELGGEIWLAPFTEWGYYLNWLGIRNFHRDREWKKYFKQSIEKKVLNYTEHRLIKPWKNFLINYHETEIAEIIKLARPFISDEYEGETILSVGKSIDYIKKGVSGIINVMPFGCMPGTIASSILKQFHLHNYEIPSLTLNFEGIGKTQNRLRLEALLFQAKESYTEPCKKQQEKLQRKYA